MRYIRFTCTILFEARILSKYLFKHKRRDQIHYSCTMADTPLNFNETKKLYNTLPNPTQSENDKKTYKVIRLPNGLTACLISDVKNDDDPEEDSESDTDEEQSYSDCESVPSSEDMEKDDEGSDMKKVSGAEQKMAAAALCVGVGSFSDIKEIPGLAHFLEHMVFMGSAKFPQENDFDSFITKRGGSNNASTDCETTVFYFECLEKHFCRALDKFAQFFIAPLMKRTSMSREREAIESEFQMALPSDSSRKEQLLFSLFNPEVPVNQFTWGSLKTLRDDVTDDFLYEKLHEFRQRHYSAHRMTLALQARLPMEVLEDFVLTSFSSVNSNELAPDNFQQYQDTIFDNPEFAKMYYVEPTKDILQVDLIWALPSLLHKYRSKPHQYVAWLLGYEGNGSLISYLRKKVWVLTIYTGNEESGTEHNSMYSLFTVHMVLTKEGLEHISEIIAAIFSYIKLICPNERIFNEIQSIEHSTFRFADEQEAVDFVEDLSEAMQFYPPEDYLCGSDLFYDYSPDDINMVLDCLKPEKMNITVLNSELSSDIKYDKVEPWFKTRYAVLSIPDEWLEQWRAVEVYPDFSLPTPNIFLTTDFSILPAIADLPEYPESILKTNGIELWYRKDQKFNLPIAYYYFNFITPMATESAQAECMRDMFLSYLNIQLMEETYQAQIAQLNYKIVPSDKGFIIKFSGYNQKLPDLIDLVSKYIVNISDSLKYEMFAAVKDKQAKAYYNRFLKPSALSNDLRMCILLNKYWSAIEKHEAIQNVSFDMLKDFAKKFVERFYIQGLVQGNVDKETLVVGAKLLLANLKCQALDVTNTKIKVFQIPKGENFCKIKSFNENDANSIITNYYQSGLYALKTSVIIELLIMLIEEPLFDKLRTKEQLGYHVFCTIRDTFGVVGYSITVNAQITKNTTLHVDGRIENFIKYVSKMLRKMSDRNLNQVKRDLIKVKNCADVLLEDEVSNNWSEIIREDYFFNRKKEEIQAIENIKISDIRKWWEDHSLCGNNSNLRKLGIQVEGHRIADNDSKTEKSDTNVQSDMKREEAVNNSKVYKVNLIDSGTDKRKCYIKSIDEFKQKLQLYPEKIETTAC